MLRAAEQLRLLRTCGRSKQSSGGIPRGVLAWRRLGVDLRVDQRCQHGEATNDDRLAETGAAGESGQEFPEEVHLIAGANDANG